MAYILIGLSSGVVIRGFLWALAFVGFCNALVGIYQYHVDSAFWAFQAAGWTRGFVEDSASGFFVSGNHFACFVAASSMWYLCYGLFSNSRLRWLVLIVFAVMAYAIVLSTSRMGIVAFGGGAFTVTIGALINRRFSGSSMISKIIMGGVVAIIILFGYGAYKQLDTHFGGKAFKHLSARSYLWKWALRQSEERCYLGTGSRSYAYYERKYRKREENWIYGTKRDMNAVYAHCDYLQLLAEYGILGVAFTLIGVVSHLGLGVVGLFRLDRKQSDESTIIPLVFGLSSCAVLLVNAVADFSFHIWPIMLSFGMGLGCISVSLPRRDTGEKTLRSGGGLLMKAGGCISLLLLAVPGIRWAKADGNLIAGRRLDPLDSLEVLKEAEALDAQNFNVPLLLADRYVTLALAPDWESISNDWREKAIPCYERVISEYPHNFDARVGLAKSLSILGRFEDAEAHFKREMSWSQNNRVIRIEYAEHLIRQGKFLEAVPHIRAALYMRLSSEQEKRYSDLLELFSELE
ncbi:MAG: O-antigen ligase family protein [Verrucomicrobiae bacterium]|nr:O-antigen ligase family protein [Verrucomicrobiae bacterium]